MHTTQATVARSIAIVLLAVMPLAAAAQDARGTISGTVVDASKSLVPGASVTATNIAMGTDVSAVTNADGFFQIPYLIPGAYKVTVELAGFKKWVRESVDVRVADRLELQVALEVGGTVEEITVSAETPLLETANGSLGNVVDSRRISELPTAHGDPYNLIGLAAGVSYTGSARLDRPFEPTHIVGYAMDGTRGNRSDLTIDGVPSTATADAGEVIASYVPPPDIVQEFKVQTATFDAAMGNTEGGVTNLSIKAGSNSFSGTAYFAKTPRGLFANDFFANANNLPLADFTYNRYGGSVGGPMLLPGYDGRRRTFFMYGFEGIHEARPRNNGTPTVPSAKMRTGDFSELLALGPQYQIYNPFTRRVAPGGRVMADPFPGNIIPAGMINPVARAALEYFGMPKTAGAADGTGNFQNPSLPETIKYATNTIRVDHNLTQKQRIYGRFSWYDRNSNYNNYFDNLSTGDWFKFISRQFAFDHVYLLDSTTVLNVRYGYNHFVRGTDTNPANHGFDLTSLGFPASYNSAIPDDIRRFPRFDITGYQGTGFGGEYRPNATNSFIATVNKSMGAHSLRTGMEYRQYRRDVRVLRQQPDRAVQLRLDVDARSARQFADGAEPARPVIRVLPARAAGFGQRRAPGGLRREVGDVGLLHSGRLEGRRSADAEPRAALRVRDGARRGRQPERARVRLWRRAADGSGGAGGAQFGGDGGAARPVPRQGRADVRRGERRAARTVPDADKQLHAAGGRDLPDQ